jgi:hypothetical protein
MPKRDQNGNVVMIARVADLDPDKFRYNDTVKTWFMLQDAFLLENGATPGFVILVDSKGCGLRHLAKISIQTIKKYCMYTQVCLLFFHCSFCLTNYVFRSTISFYTHSRAVSLLRPLNASFELNPG